MNIPEGLLFTREHEWAKLEGKNATVGITDYAQGHLGDVTFVELPKVGDKVEQFRQLATVESVKAASDVYAPFSGKIVKVNEELNNAPELINKSAYEQGWFAVIEIEKEEEKNGLMAPDQYKAFCQDLSE